MNTGSRPGGLKSDINFTPLLHVVLLLLVLFIARTPILPQRGKSVALPQGVDDLGNGTDDRPEPFILSMTSDGRVFFEEQPEVEIPSLHLQVRQAMRAHPERGLVLRADESLQVGEVRPVLRALRAAGARHVSFAMHVPLHR